MTYSVRKHNETEWAVIGPDGEERMLTEAQRDAEFYAGLLNAQHNKTTEP